MSLPPRIDTKAVRARIGAYADKKATLDERNAIYQDLIGFVPLAGRRWHRLSRQTV